MKELLAIWGPFSNVPAGIAVLVALLRWRFLLPAHRWIASLCIVGLISGIIVQVLWAREINNWPVSHLLVPVEFGMLVMYFRTEFSDSAMRLGLLILPIVFASFAAYSALNLQGIYGSNSLVRSIECAVLIALSLATWSKVMRELKHQKLAASPLFWFNAAVLIYFSGNALLFLFSEKLLKVSIDAGIWLWSVHFLFMTIYYLLFAVGLWKTKRI